jgi:hypothetical protein
VGRAACGVPDATKEEVMEKEVFREQVERRLRDALGPDHYELIGRSATEAVAVLTTGEFVSAWWELREHHGRRAVVPRFALRIPGVDHVCDVFDYGGREGFDDPDQCPLISVLVTLRPAVISVDEHRALKDVAGQRLVELKRLVDACLASDWAVRSSPPSFLDGWS